MTDDLAIARLADDYAHGRRRPAEVLEGIRERAARHADRNIWITLLDEAATAARLDALDALDPASAPLWGVPVALKDNIDLAGARTTAACEAFAYRPERDAFVARRLLAAGAIPVGKTNLDQFATGLSGTRSPWGPCRNAFDPARVSGGSSAGSAVAVALGLASLALGTDTAGSGRVPAAFNNLLGWKPTRGLLSNRGVVPACRSIDCVSVFALNADDAARALDVLVAFDPEDGYARDWPAGHDGGRYGRHAGALRLGVLPEDALAFFGDAASEAAYRATLAALAADEDVELVAIDWAPFDESARLLYEGPWVAERYAATHPLIVDDPDALHPVVRDIVAPGGELLAVDYFRAEYRLRELSRRARRELGRVDCLLTPTAGRHFTIDEMLEAPVRCNSELGYYTNFVNLLDLAAVAVPTAFTDGGLPFGVTLVGEAFDDRRLLSIANRLQTLFPLRSGATDHPTPALETTPARDGARTELLVCGAHMRGLPLNDELLAKGARLVAEVETAPAYRLHALAGGPPERPALVHDAKDGRAIAAEVWSIPTAALGAFLAGVPAPLAIGRVALADGREVAGFLCEPRALEGAREITAYGGWRAWLGRPKTKGARAGTS